MEYYFKRVFYGDGISAVPPDDYCERFVNFIDKTIFKKSKMEMMKAENEMSMFSGSKYLDPMEWLITNNFI